MSQLKHIGIVGVTAEGSALCYRTIISESGAILGVNQHPEITMNTQPFDVILDAQNKNDWKTVAEIVLYSIEKLAAVGAEFVIIPANSIHFAIDKVKEKSPIPVIDMLVETAEECSQKGYTKIGVLGVGMTMSKGLFTTALSKLGIEAATPSFEDQEIINTIIYKELVQGVINEDSTAKIIEIITKLQQNGCEAVILGCTELPLVINDTNSPLPFIDTTRLIAKRAVDYSLA